MADERFSAFSWQRYLLGGDTEHPDCALDAYGRLVMLALVRYSNDDGKAWPGFGTLCTATRLSRTKVIETVAALEACGLFVRHAQTRGAGHGSNVYQLARTPPKAAVGSAPSAPVAGRTSTPRALGSAPHAPQVVRPADGGSAPHAPYLPTDLPIRTAQELPAAGSAPHAPVWEERNQATPCPTDLPEKLIALGVHLELAQHLNVDVESVVQEMRNFRDTWVVGKLSGQSRPFWARKCRQWVVDQARQNRLTPVGAIQHEHHQRSRPVSRAEAADVEAVVAQLRAAVQG